MTPILIVTLHWWVQIETDSSGKDDCIYVMGLEMKLTLLLEWNMVDQEHYKANALSTPGP